MTNKAICRNCNNAFEIDRFRSIYVENYTRVFRCLDCIDLYIKDLFGKHEVYHDEFSMLQNETEDRDDYLERKPDRYDS